MSESPGDPGNADDLRFSVGNAERAIEAAAACHARRDLTAVDRTLAVLKRRTGADERAIDAATGRVMRSHVTRLWSIGWLPVDVYQMARRNSSDIAAALAVDVIADEIQQYAEAAIHPRWRLQLTSLGATRWWDGGMPLTRQWARRHGLGRDAALRVIVELVALFFTMGPLPVIVPPPGTHTGSDRGGRAGNGTVDEKLLGKIRALLAKAESTEYSEEAEALSAKAQELMARHSIDHAMATSEAKGTPEASARRIWLDAPYIGAKSLLVAHVASANHCRSVAYEKIGFVTVLGDDVDLEHVELLTTSLMVQAARSMISAGRHVSRTGQSRTRSFRHAFLVAYAARIGERLREVTEGSIASAGKDLVPVLAHRDEATEQLFNALFADRVVARSFSIGNAEGYRAGRTAADQATLTDIRRPVSGR